MSSRRLSLLCAALGIAATIGRANSGEAALGDLFCDSNRDSNAGELANLGGLAERMAARGATTAIDRIAIGKLTDIVRSGQLLRGERRLLSQLPKLESAEGQRVQNELNELNEMKGGNPIRDASWDPHRRLDGQHTDLSPAFNISDWLAMRW